jgi:hypothetical protein
MAASRAPGGHGAGKQFNKQFACPSSRPSARGVLSRTSHQIKPARKPPSGITVEYRMARGFESKDVEYQQAERERLQARRAGPTQEQRAATSRRGAVELSLARMRSELENVRVAAHRTMIERAIATLEAELASLP